ncbi:hypothetical protein MMB17_18430 [Methylobacterium organophilum]|uniref:hypothetical protein n=1 Tax=Methylobacterium organophilum TaxID=410 RepID=UPI001F13763A|nr:hypothetical protein [Methylobacterium organophilum]UMY16641.1 hypothetical protein MMB17_18430 [Methylobacterium organophilum]
MSTAQAEARTLVELIAGPLRLGENVKAALARVALVTGIGDRRIRGIWNNEARIIRAEEMDRLRQVALDARTREELDSAYRAHLARLRACQEALRVPSALENRTGPDGERRVAGGADRALDRTAA